MVTGATYTLVVHDNAVDSLRRIGVTNGRHKLRLAEYLRQLRSDEFLLGKMLEHDFDVDKYGRSTVRKWRSIQNREKLPVWRLRDFDLEADGINYRFIYLYYFRDRTHYLLEVVPKCQLKDEDYDDPNNPIRKRIIAIIRDEFPDA